jgi:AcrR family transcriptional regulator
VSRVNRSRDERAEIRRALIEAAARLIATEGVGALTLRRAADEVGTSTMAIYTHFGGMPELRRAVRREGFAKLAARGARVGESDDPVADVAMLGLEYYDHAVSDPHVYRVMYMEQPLDEDDAETGWDTFNTLAAAMRRCIDAGRFAPADAEDLAREFWALGHGVITLQLAQLLSAEQARSCLLGAVTKLFRSYGDDPRAMAESLARAARRTESRVEPDAA